MGKNYKSNWIELRRGDSTYCELWCVFTLHICLLMLWRSPSRQPCRRKPQAAIWNYNTHFIIIEYTIREKNEKKYVLSNVHLVFHSNRFLIATPLASVIKHPGNLSVTLINSVANRRPAALLLSDVMDRRRVIGEKMLCTALCLTWVKSPRQ